MKYERDAELSQPKLLLGEGIEEFYFFSAFLKHLGRDDVQIDQYGGKSKLAQAIKALAVRPGFSAVESLAVTRDADFASENSDGAMSAASSAFESIRSALKAASLPEPDQVGRLTTGPFQGRTIRTGAYVFPGGNRDGMLEDLCLNAVAADLAIPCVDALIQCSAEKANRRCSSNDLPKARLNAWLATQIPPDKRLGQAAADGFFNWDDAAFNDLRAFLSSI